MKIQILSGVMIFGQPVFPTVTTGTGDKAKTVNTIIDIDKKEAKELVLRGQAKKIADKDQKSTKATFTLKDLQSESESDSIDAFFSEDSETEEE